jgi:hypothetical protein
VFIRTQGDYIVNYNNGKHDVSIEYNICDYAMRKGPDNGTLKDFANMNISSTNQFFHISTSSLTEVGVSLIDKTKQDMGINLLFGGGSVCTYNSTKKFSLQVQLQCDDKAKETTYAIDTSNLNDPCSPKVIMVSKNACPVFSLHTLWRWGEYYKHVIGLLMLLTGFLLLMCGGRNYKLVMFFTGQVTTGLFLTFLLFGAVYPGGSPFWVVWLTLFVTLGIGAGIGYAAQKWSRMGVLMLGVSCGAIGGALLYTLVFYHFSSSNPILVIWLCIAFCSVVAGVVCMVFFDNAIIFGSAALGAYLFIRGVATMAGGFPNEFVVYLDYKNGTISEVPFSFFVYVGAMLVATVISTCLQL